MAVTHQQIIRITDSPLPGFKMLHLAEDRGVVVNAAWVAENRPEVGGYLIDNGRGETWFAANSLGTLPAVLVEVQRITAKPGEVVLFRLPGGSYEAGESLREYLEKAAPELRCIVATSELDVSIISAEPAPKPCSMALHAEGKPAPANCVRCGLVGPCMEKLGEAFP